MSAEDIRLMKQVLINLAKVDVDENNFKQCYIDLDCFKSVAKSVLMHLEGVCGNVNNYEVKE